MLLALFERNPSYVGFHAVLLPAPVLYPFLFHFFHLHGAFCRWQNPRIIDHTALDFQVVVRSRYRTMHCPAWSSMDGRQARNAKSFVAHEAAKLGDAAMRARRTNRGPTLNGFSVERAMGPDFCRFGMESRSPPIRMSVSSVDAVFTARNQTKSHHRQNKTTVKIAAAKSTIPLPKFASSRTDTPVRHADAGISKQETKFVFRQKEASVEIAEAETEKPVHDVPSSVPPETRGIKPSPYSQETPNFPSSPPFLNPPKPTFPHNSAANGDPNAGYTKPFPMSFPHRNDEFSVRHCTTACAFCEHEERVAEKYECLLRENERQKKDIDLTNDLAKAEVDLFCARQRAELDRLNDQKKSELDCRAIEQMQNIALSLGRKTLFSLPPRSAHADQMTPVLPPVQSDLKPAIKTDCNSNKQVTGGAAESRSRPFGTTSFPLHSSPDWAVMAPVPSALPPSVPWAPPLPPLAPPQTHWAPPPTTWAPLPPPPPGFSNLQTPATWRCIRPWTEPTNP